MLASIRTNRRTQLVLGLLVGILFGFLLQKGGAAEHDVILGQLLLTDFTVVKIMLTAVVSETMPLGNITEMTDEERILLGRWLRQGAKIE